MVVMTMKKISQLSNAQALQLQREAAIKGRTGRSDNQFASMMQERLQQTEGVQFSKHAENRIKQRGINMSEDVMANLNLAVERARAKGAKDTVIIGSEGAFIVNVPNNIVVTTISEQEMKNNIFTNIDSAVLM